MRSLTHAAKQPAVSGPAARASVPSVQHPAEALQRSLGNRATQQLVEMGALADGRPPWPKTFAGGGLRVQCKLAVNQPGDVYEQEADCVADQVTSAPDHSAVGDAPVQIQRLAGPPDGQVADAPASVDGVIASPGTPLAPALRQDMERRFGHDFSRVRVHADADAERSAREVNARAYAVGHDIVFGAGRFAPGTTEGRSLLAHELTHIVQQTGGHGEGAARLQRQPEPVTRETARAEFSGKYFYYLIRDDIQWHFDESGWYIDLVIFFQDPKTRHRFSDKEIAATCLAVWEASTGLQLKEGKRDEIARHIEESLAEMGDSRAYRIGFDYAHFEQALDEKSWAAYKATLRASLGGDDVFLNGQLIASGNFATGAAGAKGAPGASVGDKTSQRPGWVDARYKDITALVEKARRATERPKDLPDRVVLWYNDRDGSWYFNVWAYLDTRGEEKAGNPVKLKAGETTEELWGRVRDAAAQALQRAEDRERRARAAELAPAWARALEAALRQRLDALHAREKDARDFPDGMVLVPGPQVSLQIWVERGEGAHAERNTGSVPLVPSATVDLLIPYVRHLAALLREFENTAERAGPPPEISGDDPQKQGLDAFPARIRPVDLRGDNVTVTDAKNEFQMELDYEAIYGSGGPLNDLATASKLYQQYIHFYWQVYPVPADVPLPEGSEKAPEIWSRRWEWLYGAFNPSTEAAREKRAIPALGAPVTSTDGSDSTSRVRMPEEPGDYLVRCVTASAPIGESKLKRVPSEAYYPVRVRPIEEVVKGASSLRIGAITAIDADLRDIEEQLAGDKLRGPEHAHEREVLLARQQLRTSDLGRLQSKETETLAQNTSEEIAYANEMLARTQRLKDLLPGVLARAKAQHVAPSSLLAETPELLEVYWRLIFEGKTAEAYEKELKKKIEQLQGVRKRAGEFSNELKTSSRYQYSPEAAFASEVTGQVSPLVLMLGEAPDKVKQAKKVAAHGDFAMLEDPAKGVAYSLVDVTSPQTQKVYYGYSEKPGAEGHREAIDDAFRQFGEDATYGKGLLAVRIPPGAAGATDANYPGAQIRTYRSKEGILQKVLWALGIIAAVAGVAALVATGIGAPVAAGLLGAVAATAGAITALSHISERQRRHTLEFDAELVLDILSVISVVPAGVGARLALQTAASVRVAVLTENFLKIYSLTETGATLILVPTKLAQDIHRIESDDELTPEQKRLMIAQARLGAVQSGVMMLGGIAASHAGGRGQQSESFVDEYDPAVRQQIEAVELEGFGEYQSMEERGWLDAKGDWTELAPEIVRATAATAEAPPVEPVKAPKIEPAHQEAPKPEITTTPTTPKPEHHGFQLPHQQAPKPEITTAPTTPKPEHHGFQLPHQEAPTPKVTTTPSEPKQIGFKPPSRETPSPDVPSGADVQSRPSSDAVPAGGSPQPPAAITDMPAARTIPGLQRPGADVTGQAGSRPVRASAGPADTGASRISQGAAQPEQSPTKGTVITNAGPDPASAAPPAPAPAAPSRQSSYARSADERLAETQTAIDKARTERAAAEARVDKLKEDFDFHKELRKATGRTGDYADEGYDAAQRQLREAESQLRQTKRAELKANEVAQDVERARDRILGIEKEMAAIQREKTDLTQQPDPEDPAKWKGQAPRPRTERGRRYAELEKAEAALVAQRESAAKELEGTVDAAAQQARFREALTEDQRTKLEQLETSAAAANEDVVLVEGVYDTGITWDRVLTPPKQAQLRALLHGKGVGDAEIDRLINWLVGKQGTIKVVLGTDPVRSSANYRALFAEEHGAPSPGADIHHGDPLYLGGGHDPASLFALPEEAHDALHGFFDNLTLPDDSLLGESRLQAGELQSKARPFARPAAAVVDPETGAVRFDFLK
jgi:Domain of unknown function (DUF4157)